MRALLLALLLASPSATQDTITLTVAPADRARRYVVAEAEFAGRKLPAPLRLRERESGKDVPCQWESADGGTRVRWLIADLPAGQKRSYVLQRGEGESVPPLTLREDSQGWLSVRAPDREITRYNFARHVGTHRKPYFYPLVVQGVNVLRGFPMEEREGEAKDHPHQTGIYHAYGEVNGKDYWSKVPIDHKRILVKEAGAACARIVSENHWGTDLVERQDVLVLNAGPDAVMDWTITLTAANEPVVLGKNKEGSFAVRVAAGLSAKGDAADKLLDSKGNKGEKAIRADSAPWVHYAGDVEGKRVGVSIMQHPSGFRSPSTWHVRAYGLFAANPYYVAGEHKLARGESITLRYRVYVHGGDFAVGRVADVFAGYSGATVAVE